MYQFTSIGRAVDPNYPTNRAIALATLVIIAAGTIFRLFSGDGFLESLGWGFWIGLAVFLTWAVARELDPDYDRSAFVAAGLMLVAALFWDRPNFLILFWLLLAIRIVNRSVGLPAKPMDSILILALGGWLAWSVTWLLGLTMTMTFFLDSRMHERNRRHVLFEGAAFLVTIVVAFLQDAISLSDISLWPGLLSLAAGLLFLLVVYQSRTVATVCDVGEKPLIARRVQAGQLLLLATASGLLLVQGDAGFVALLPLWSAFLGTALYHLVWVR